ncbi:unnamed protein product, partial [Mesorhabditis belari]|uniref:Adapter molecule crk n=1 Tax=Mesorhabditis belari TaxID=2138241 RepID=A0AAF3FDA1_9BILA
MAGPSGGAFDPFEWNAFYFPKMSREEAVQILSENDVQLGTFLLRDSSRPGTFSLSVRESDEAMKVRHYLIEKNESGGVKIAEQTFIDLPQLLNHFKLRILDKTSLTIPYRKRELERVQALFRFEGTKETDLSFEAGEQLDIIGKPEPEWWQARNAMQRTGLIPANYVAPLGEVDRNSRGEWSSSSSSGPSRHSTASTHDHEQSAEPRLPAQAFVVHDRTPNVYDTAALRLQKGQQVEVLRKIGNGFYEGIVDGKRGTFPHTYVRWE